MNGFAAKTSFHLSQPPSGSNTHFLSFFADGKFHVVPSGDLHVIRADFADAVESYACRVRNTLNNKEEISQAFSLIINDSGLPTKPVQLSQQSLFFTFRAEDETAVLTCNVQSNPPPAFSWFRVRDNLLEPISRSNRIYLAGGILIIDNVQVRTLL